MNLDYFVPFFFYTVSTIVLFLISVSWITAYRMKRSIPVLSFAIFFTVVATLTFVISFDLLRLCLGMYKTAVPFLWLRSILMFGSSIFLLYGTWKNK